MKKLLAVTLASALAFGTATALAEMGIPQKHIQFAKGQSSAAVSGKIRGNKTIDYQVRASAGQSLSVAFKANRATAYFNILPPGGGEALFVGSSLGNHFTGNLPSDGIYTLRVYQMGAAKSEGKETRFTLKVGISPVHNSSGSGNNGGKAHDFAPGSFAEIVGVHGDWGLLSGPAMSERVIGHISEGRLVRVLKCEPNDGLWCEVEAHSDKQLRGWVKGQNLRAK
jgi:hypothetical protein